MYTCCDVTYVYVYICLFYIGTIDAKELNVAMRYVHFHSLEHMTGLLDRQLLISDVVKC